MATITLDKIEKAQELLNEVQQKASDVNEILVKVREDIIEGLSLTSEQKTALLDEYNNRKTALQNAVQNLL